MHYNIKRKEEATSPDPDELGRNMIPNPWRYTDFLYIVELGECITTLNARKAA